MVFFKRLGSRHIHKEIKLQEGLKVIDYILCKTGLNVLRIQAYNCNNFNDVLFEARFKSAYVPLWYLQFYQKSIVRKGVVSFYVMTLI